MPHIKIFVDNSDNAGCYHNEVFNERQAGKDQCDKDSATAKRQINYYIWKWSSIECAVNMMMCY